MFCDRITKKGDIVLYETNTDPVRCGHGTVDCIDDLKTEYEFGVLTKISNAVLIPIGITKEKQAELVMPNDIDVFKISQCILSVISLNLTITNTKW